MDDSGTGSAKALYAPVVTISAASAASAAVDHMATLWHGTPDGDYTSISLYQDGSHYGIPEGIVCSVPCTVRNRVVTVVDDVQHVAWAQEKIAASADDLVNERAAVADLLG